MSNNSNGIGSTRCTVTCAVVGILLAILLVTVGFWKTVFVLAMGAVGAFIGGVPNKLSVIKDIVNKLVPGDNAHGVSAGKKDEQE